MVSPSRKQETIRALEDRGVDLPCPRCGARSFDVVAESSVEIQEKLGGMSTGNSAMPVVVIACVTCGFLMNHAQGPLGLLRPS